MLFDVVLLRCAGRRRLRADVLRDMPVRGDVATADTGARAGLVATLKVAGELVMSLRQCRVTRVTTESLVLAGVESLPDGSLQQQEWWCRTPGGGPPRPYDPEPPSVVVRDLSYAPGLTQG
jgi:hypothetical protein